MFITRCEIIATGSKHQDETKRSNEFETMKEIKAYIRPRVFDDLCSELKSKGYGSMTVTESEGIGSYTDPDKKLLPNLRIP